MSKVKNKGATWRIMGRDDELACVFIEEADALYAEYAARGVEFTQGVANVPWHSREFVVKDCDGCLLAFGSNLQLLNGPHSSSSDENQVARQMRSVCAARAAFSTQLLLSGQIQCVQVEPILRQIGMQTPEPFENQIY